MIEAEPKEGPSNKDKQPTYSSSVMTTEIVDMRDEESFQQPSLEGDLENITLKDGEPSKTTRDSELPEDDLITRKMLKFAPRFSKIGDTLQEGVHRTNAQVPRPKRHYQKLGASVQFTTPSSKRHYQKIGASVQFTTPSSKRHYQKISASVQFTTPSPKRHYQKIGASVRLTTPSLKRHYQKIGASVRLTTLSPKRHYQNIGASVQLSTPSSKRQYQKIGASVQLTTPSPKRHYQKIGATIQLTTPSWPEEAVSNDRCIGPINHT
ncbi:Protein CBG16907 [Senna tora]|uniref:Protein CBG16907 n=1 Tax=Senna tora TaxID=362788 RepID=A0A834WVX2_9FABA|nr:Protein CBG16907 [Senna tora]